MNQQGPREEAHPEAWDEWATMLDRYAGATGMTVSAYDEAGGRRVGPFHGSRVGRMLEGSALWSEAGPGSEFERALARQAMQSLAPVERLYEGELRVAAQPLVIGGRLSGAVCYGWVPAAFGSGLGSERIARAIGLSGRALWGELRLHPPVSEARMRSYSALLGTLIDAGTRLREVIAEFQDLARAREQFLARVAHELRTPLASMSMRLGVILAKPLDDGLRAQLEAVSRNLKDEARLVADIVESARSRTGQLSIETARCDLAQVLDDALAAIQPGSDAKGVLLEREPGLDAAPVLADAARLRQALWNLIANAVKFTPPGGTVRASLREVPAGYALDISDTGSGIAPELLPGIFEPFTRTTQDNATGMGLGLAIARHIVELHGGTISAASAGQGRGAVFTVTMPAADA